MPMVSSAGTRTVRVGVYRQACELSMSKMIVEERVDYCRMLQEFCLASV